MGEGTPITPCYITCDALRTSLPNINILSWFIGEPGSACGGLKLHRDDCKFCKLEPTSFVAENALALAVRDKFPVMPLHTLIIPKRHITDIFHTFVEEREAIHALALLCIEDIARIDPRVEGFNFGSNVGQAAGQRIFHAHVHLIPRRTGDAPPPPARQE